MGVMTIDQMKATAAEAALKHVAENELLGVGTGSTANCFIDALARSGRKIRGAVASSVASAERLRGYGIPIVELDEAGTLPLYVDGADEATADRFLIKGGGGALTREKIVAAVSRRFVCIADERKLVETLGRFPLPVEIIPMARKYVCRQVERLGGGPVERPGFVTDNGNLILDVHGLTILDPCALEEELNHIAGVVTNGLFARRGADVLILGTQDGVRVI